MIEAHQVFKSFGETTVLKGVSATFDQGKTNLIIGQSGSGKTVFLKCLLGLFDIDQGAIFYNQKSLLEMSPQDRIQLRQDVGMVFQGSALFDSITVAENIMFPMQMLTNKSIEEIRERAQVVIKRVNLIDADNKKPSEISGGMQKRVAIARAIVMNPKYLFCDEPNSGLDPKTAILIDNLIQEITEEYQITTVINTHDMNSVMGNRPKIIFLENGQKAWEGNKEEIFTTDNQSVGNFVYSSELFKKVRTAYLNKLA